MAPEKLQSTASWRRIQEEFLATGRAEGVLEGLTQATDAIALAAYGSTIEPIFPKFTAMLAVGAYGRRETFPYSGADIVILHEADPEAEPLKSALAEMVLRLWEAGLRLNYTPATVAECLGAREQNPELAVSLLDRRLLGGDAALAAKLESKLPATLAKHGQKLADYLCRSSQARHAKYGNTVHHVEPDVKDGPGGLRDIRLVDRLARLNPEHGAPGEKLREAFALVSSARCFLHYHTGQDRNVLDHEAQESLGMQPFAHGVAPWQWMREYFRNARAVFNMARRAMEACEKSGSSLLENFREYRSRLSNGEFTVSHDRVFLRNPGHLASDPGQVFELLEFIGAYGVRPAADTERRLEAERLPFAEWCAGPRPLWPSLQKILASPHASMALRALDDTGLLPALFPEWAQIEHLPVTDPERRYTADEHTLRAIERVAELRAAADPAKLRIAEQLSEVDNPALLNLALLFCEMGRGADDTAEAAAGSARAAMTRIQVPPGERATVEFLVRHQHDLADAMGGRDMENPATARLLADRVETVERLKLLTVLTYAMLSAGSPDAMTPWRLEQLWSAYRATRQELTRELETDRIQQVPEDLPEHSDFIKGFPTRYLRARPKSEIEAHLQLYELSRPTGVAVRLDEAEGAYRVTVVARDKPFLFASLAGAISSFGLDILKAEAFSNSKGVVLDTFVFADRKRMLQQNPSEMERLSDLLRRVALGKTDARRLMRDVALPETARRAAPPQIQFDSEACETATLVEIVAEDRPGLLYSLASVLSSSACNIDVVLIDTKGRRAIDVFYVAQDGRKLSPDVQAMLKEKLIAAC